MKTERKKQRLCLSRSVMLSLEMVKAALMLISGRDFPWNLVNIQADPVRRGRDLECLTHPLAVWCGCGDATQDEVLRTVCVEGSYLGDGGVVPFESKCELHNYRSMWEPRFVDVKIGDDIRRFYYINEWDGGKRYRSVIREVLNTEQG